MCRFPQCSLGGGRGGAERELYFVVNYMDFWLYIKASTIVCKLQTMVGEVRGVALCLLYQGSPWSRARFHCGGVPWNAVVAEMFSMQMARVSGRYCFHRRCISWS